MVSEARMRRSAGYGLLDLVVGAALLAVAVMAAAQLVLDTNNMRQSIEIQRLVGDRLDEELKMVESASFATIFDDHHQRGFSLEDERIRLQAPQGDPDGLPGHVEVLVPDPPNDPSSLLEARVEVQWSDRTGTHERQFRQLVSRFAGGP